MPDNNGIYFTSPFGSSLNSGSSLQGASNPNVPNTPIPGIFGDPEGFAEDFQKNNPTTAEGVLDYLQNNQGDESSRDLLYQYLLGEKSLNDAYQRELAADSSKYQRLVEDLKKAGINPMFALGGAGAGNISSQGSSYSSSYETRRSHLANEKLSGESLKEQKRKNNMDFLTNILRIAVSAAGIAMLA